MKDTTSHRRVVVIGAGIGGLTAALTLAAQGLAVTVLERHPWVGGKMRTLPSTAGPVDAGPTVLTMRSVFDSLFAQTGTPLDAHLTLTREPCLARHFWRDGSQLDLCDDTARNAEAIDAFAGGRARREFLAFSAEAADLLSRFDAPMMHSPNPSVPQLAYAVLSTPRVWRATRPWAKLSQHLRTRFSDPRLRQLFARYATYVGGLPHRSPALLALIWQAEAAGVWRVEGGMHQLATAIATRITTLGGTLRLGVGAAEIRTAQGRVESVILTNGEALRADAVVFNGDPRALALGQMGGDTQPHFAELAARPRSLSARVWSFAAQAEGLDLLHHNVLFADDAQEEFDAIAKGQMPQNPSLYICAQDRGTDRSAPKGQERFEIILNAAPLTTAQPLADEARLCQTITQQQLHRFGLTLTPAPTPEALALPQDFATLFPASDGALYGQSPHGMRSALTRPRAKTRIKGLYLAGGGTHPGPGVPMAALSGRFAAKAILKDHALM